jgi:hypothetical protein
MNNKFNILHNKILDIKNQIDSNIEYNKTDDSRLEVEKRILKWEKLVSTINELNFSAIESTINIEISQLDKDIFAINSAFVSHNSQNDTIRLAMQEAELIGNRVSTPEKIIGDNVSKLNMTRDLMKRAGLI